MLKTLNLRLNRVSVKILSINRCLCSQIAKTNEDINKIEDRKHSDISVEKSENQSKELSERKASDLSRVIKSPIHMDFHWEMNLEEKLPPTQKLFFDYKGGISVDLLGALHRKYDLSIPGIKRRIKYYVALREQYNQRFIRKRHAILGPELASAHFVIYRGGMARFKHAPNVWIKECEKLPNVYDSKYRVIDLNASKCKLRWESMDNFILLDSLEELNLSKNKFLDDFCCDKIGRLFRNSKNLSVLDLSDNPLITHRGIETLHRIRSLKKLIISGTNAANYPFIELLIILFNDVNPNCRIVI